MSNLWKLIAVAIGAALVACQWTPPHSSALEEARRAYKMARADPLVAQAAAAELQDAQTALRRAELSWIVAHDDALTSHLAYLAYQRVAIARNAGLQREAEQRLQRAEQETQRLLATQAPAPPAPRAVGQAQVVPVNLQPGAAPVAATPAPAMEPPAIEAPAVERPAVDPPAAAPDARATMRVPVPPAARPGVRGAPGKPALPPQVQARLERAPSRPSINIAPRHDRRLLAQATVTHRPALAHRAKAAAGVHKRGVALAQDAPKQRRREPLPEVWSIEAQGRPFVVPPLNPPHPLRWLTSSGRLSE